MPISIGGNANEAEGEARVVTREWRWLLHDRVALILIFGVPLFAFVVLTAVFSQPVIRGLGVVVVDADRSDTRSRRRRNAFLS